MKRAAWHIVAEADRGRPVPMLYVPAPPARIDERCSTFGKVRGYGAICTRRHLHSGRHAHVTRTRRVLAVWP